MVRLPVTQEVASSSLVGPAILISTMSCSQVASGSAFFSNSKILHSVVPQQCRMVFILPLFVMQYSYLYKLLVAAHAANLGRAMGVNFSLFLLMHLPFIQRLCSRSW